MAKSLHTQEYKIFRKYLAKVRDDRGFTQTGLAEILGKPQSFVSKYESGERRLDVIEFLAVCEALKLDSSVALKTIVNLVRNEYERSDRCGK